MNDNQRYSILLTPSEMDLARWVRDRIISINAEKGRRSWQGGASQDTFSNEMRTLLGAVVEIGVSKVLNLHWLGNIDNCKAVDVGGIVDVKGVIDDSNRLVIPDGAELRRRYVSALWPGEGNVVVLRGWMYGTECKPEWIEDKRPRGVRGYYVPNSALYPMASLISAFSVRARA